MAWYWKKDLRLKDENAQAWEKYNDADMKRIEKQYQKNKRASFAFDDTYQIDLERMIQHRKDDDDRQRPIKRVTLKTRWYWKKDLRLKDENEAAWLPYSAEESEKLEEENQAGNSTFHYDDTYDVDLTNMIQFRRDDPERQRPIKRKVLEGNNNEDEDEEDEDRKKNKTSDNEEEDTEPKKKKQKTGKKEEKKKIKDKAKTTATKSSVLSSSENNYIFNFDDLDDYPLDPNQKDENKMDDDESNEDEDKSHDDDDNEEKKKWISLVYSSYPRKS